MTQKRDSVSVDRGRFLFSQLSVLLGHYQGRGHVLFVHREPIRIKRVRTTAANVPEGPPSLEHHLSINVSQSDIISVEPLEYKYCNAAGVMQSQFYNHISHSTASTVLQPVSVPSGRFTVILSVK